MAKVKFKKFGKVKLVQYDTPEHPGVTAKSGWLYGVDGQDDFSITQYLGKSEFSYVCFVRPSVDINYQSGSQMLFNMMNDAGSQSFFIALGSSASALTNEYICVGKASARTGVVSTVENIPAGELTMIAVCIDASGTSIYVNGVSKTVTTSGGGVASGTNSVTANRLSMGTQIVYNTDTIGNFFYGEHTEISFWNKTLNSTEVSDLYTAYQTEGYSLTDHADYASSVFSYYKKKDIIKLDIDAHDTKVPGQKLKWHPVANWGMSKISGNFQALPSESGFVNTKIWESTVAGSNCFNHFSRLFEHNGRLHVQWITHSYDEHGPGQTLRYSYSDDFGATWSSVVNLFDPMDDITVRLATREGRQIHAVGFVPIGSDLYALGDVIDESDLLSGFVGIIARKVNSDGSLGTPFWPWIYGGGTSVTPVSGYPSYSYNSSLWAQIVAYYTTPGKRQGTAASGGVVLESKLNPTTNAYSVTGTLIEPSEIVIPYSNDVYRIWRAYNGSLNQDYYYAYYGKDTQGDSFYKPYITNIPYPVSLGSIGVVDNKIILIGNPENSTVIGRDPLILAIADAEMQFKESSVYNLREDGEANRFDGGSKNGAFSYPSFIRMSNGRIGCSYTTYGKEDIEFMSFLLP